MPGSDNRNSMLIDDFLASLEIKHERRIVDFQQPPGKFRITRNR